MEAPLVRTEAMGRQPWIEHASTMSEAMNQIGYQWRITVIKSLLNHPMRFHELKSVIDGIEGKTLSRVLKYLESQQIIRREVLRTRPISVQYALTEKGAELKPVVDSLQVWGEKWIPGAGKL